MYSLSMMIMPMTEVTVDVSQAGYVDAYCDGLERNQIMVAEQTSLAAKSFGEL